MKAAPPRAKCSLRCGDGIAGMQKMPAESAHFIATDPPYFLDGMGDEWNARQLRRRVKPGVVGGLPAGMKFSRKQAARLREFMARAGAEMLRVLKPGGFAAVFSAPRLAFAVGAALDAAGFEIRDMLAWRFEGQAKAFSQAHFVRRMDLPAAQKARVLARLEGRKTPQLKPQFEAILLAQKPRQGTFVENWLRYEVGLISPRESLLGAGFPGTVLEAPKPKRGGALGHMTVKPVVIMRQLIRLFSLPGQTILDPFAGSGTTAVAALTEGRRFAGFEIDPQYVKTARRRIRDEGGAKHRG